MGCSGTRLIDERVLYATSVKRPNRYAEAGRAGIGSEELWGHNGPRTALAPTELDSPSAWSVWFVGATAD